MKFSSKNDECKPSSEAAMKQAKREHLERQCFSQGRHSPVWPYVFGFVLVSCAGAFSYLKTSKASMDEMREKKIREAADVVVAAADAVASDQPS